VNPFERIEKELSILGSLGMRRSPGDAGLRKAVFRNAMNLGVPFVDVSSNDYLGYARGDAFVDEKAFRFAKGEVNERQYVESVSRETLEGVVNQGDRERCLGRENFGEECAQKRLGYRENPGGAGLGVRRAGGGASRLLGGTYEWHEDLEGILAEWVGQESALVFASGYAANVGLLSSIPLAGDVVFSDELNHASIIDGCRLGRAQVLVYKHRNLEELVSLIRGTSTDGKKWVVTESYFSMDGDSPNLSQLRTICDDYGVGLIVDEAHAIGTFGVRGAGLLSAASVGADVYVGAFGKSVGLSGGFVAGRKVVKEWLWNRARSFVFSTAMTARQVEQITFHVKHIQRDEQGRTNLARSSQQVREGIQRIGLKTVQYSYGPIIPIVLGQNHVALDAAGFLQSRGILAYPIRPPTVPEGTARLRLTLNAALSEMAIEHLLRTLEDLTTAIPATRQLT
jgi:8-amino-7-oxononanoate synthase